jgi:hypothetical protein
MNISKSKWDIEGALDISYGDDSGRVHATEEWVPVHESNLNHGVHVDLDSSGKTASSMRSDCVKTALLVLRKRQYSLPRGAQHIAVALGPNSALQTLECTACLHECVVMRVCA